MSRIIHTDTYSDKAELILTKLHDYMFDSWGSHQMSRNARLAKIERQPNGEVTWTVDNHDACYSWSSYSKSTYATRKDDKKVREWLCMVLKRAILTDGYKWSRKNKDLISRWSRDNNGNLLSDPKMTVTVAEAYCLYDKLLNRKRFSKNNAKGLQKTIVGVERDDVQTQLEIARREEVEKLNAKLKTDRQALEHKKYDAVEAAKTKIYEEYRILEDNLVKDYNKAMKELTDSLNFMSNGI